MTPLAELLAPNLHVALIHYPLGLLVGGVVIELFAILWPNSSVRVAGRWLVLLGTLSAVPAAFSGIYALRSVARIDLADQHVWADVRANSPVLSDPVIWRQMKVHTTVQSIATGAAVLAAVTWLGAGDAARRTLRGPVLAVLVLAVGGMIVGAWFGGEAIYKHGVGVERGWPAVEQQPAPTQVEDWFPPVELHVVMAGTTVAVALAAIGLSFRKLSLTVNPPVADADDHGSTHLARSFNPNLAVDAAVPPLPSAKFWLLATLLAVGTSLGGWFVLARSADVLVTVHGHYAQVPQVLWGLVKPDRDHGHLTLSRRFFHMATGGVIALVPLMLAALAQWLPRRRILLAAFTLILAAAVATQVWFGVLLLYDTADGPINHFNPSAADAAATAAE